MSNVPGKTIENEQISVKPTEPDKIGLDLLDDWTRGFFAGAAGREDDPTESEAWQIGWADAHGVGQTNEGNHSWKLARSS